MELDSTWNILWPVTSTNKEAIQQCLGNGQLQTCNEKLSKALQSFKPDIHFRWAVGTYAYCILDYSTPLMRFLKPIDTHW